MEEFSGIRVWFLSFFFFFSVWIIDLERSYIYLSLSFFFFFFVNRRVRDYSFSRAHILGNIREVLLGENLTEEFLGTRVWFLFFSSSWITDLESIYIYIFLKSTFEDVHDYSFPRMYILGNIRKILLGENVTEEFLEIRV